MWKHVTKVDLVIQCKYCTKEWGALSLHGSTSNPLKHLKQHHFNKISEQDKDELSRNGETSGNRGQPKRTLYRKEHETGPLPRNHRLVKQIDRKVARLIVSSTVSCSQQGCHFEDKNFEDINFLYLHFSFCFTNNLYILFYGRPNKFPPPLQIKKKPKM